MKKKLAKTLLVLLCICSIGQGQTSKTLTLSEAVDFALRDNTDIKKQNLSILQSRQKVSEVAAQGLPQISASSQLVDNLVLAKTLLPGEILGSPGTTIAVTFGSKYTIPLSARVDLILFNMAYIVGVKQAKEGLAMAIKMDEKTKQDVIYNVASAYYQALIVREQTNLIKANLDKVQQSLKVVQSQFENQMARKIDLDQLKVTLANTQTDYENTQVQYAFVLNQLKILMGYPIADSLVLHENITDKNSFSLQNTIADNPKIELLKSQERLKMLDVKAVQAKYSPSIVGFGSYGYQGQSNSLNQLAWYESSSVGFQASIPIFDGFQKRHQVKQAKFAHQSLQLDEELLINSLNMQFNNAIKKYLQNQKNVENQAANLELAQSVYEAMQINYKNGLASLSDLINSDTGLKNAQSQYLNSLLQLKISGLDILYVNGKMTQLTVK